MNSIPKYKNEILKLQKQTTSNAKNGETRIVNKSYKTFRGLLRRLTPLI